MAEPLDVPKHKDLIYDIGLHKGEDAALYLRKGFRVVAFEADPDLVRGCQVRFREFIEAGRLTIVEGAIIDPRGPDAGRRTVRFYKNEDHSFWGTARAAWSERNARLGKPSREIDVDVVDFAGALRDHGMPRYMKIDIEGSDLACLGALEMFSGRPDYISIEADKTSLRNVRREIDTLVLLGYDSFQAVEQSAIPSTQTPPDPPTEGLYVGQRFEPGSSGLFGTELADRWKSKRAILWQYRAILLGYYLLGDEGLMSRWKFPKASWLREPLRRLLRIFTKGPVPGWYDTHARHRRADRPTTG